MPEGETTSLAFDVDAALLIELGERLVARRSVALAELLKNAYDADATEVVVSFEDVKGPRGSIEVLDDGSGMTLEALKRGWMRIATNDATINARSTRFGRPRTGAKGIGRFACGRLASRLSLESTSSVSGGSERIRAEFNWEDFEPGRDLADVTSSVTRELLDDELPTGTSLRLSGLKDGWTEGDLAELQAEFRDLMNLDELGGYVRRNHDHEADPGFEVQILAPEFPRFEGAIGEPFLEAAWALLTGTVTDRGEPQYELNLLDTDILLQHKPHERSFPDLHRVAFTIRMMVYQGGRFRGSGYNLREARDLGRARGGVRVYLDGFQVFSYGSPGDDWLDLDQERARRQAQLPKWLETEAGGLDRPMLSLPGNMQLFGSVSISRENNPGLAVSIGRDRLVQNDSFQQLKQFVRDGIDWMTVCRAREAAAVARDRPRETGDSDGAASVAQALQSLRSAVVHEAAIPDEARRAIETSLDEAEALLRQETAAQASELSMLRVLASAGTTVVVFDHMLRTMARQLREIGDAFELLATHVPPEHLDGYQEALDDLRSWSTMAFDQGSLVGLLLAPEARTRPRSRAVRPLVENLERGFAKYLDHFSITLENEVPPAVRTPSLYEPEMYAVLLNLLTNSFKAVREGVPERRVRVEAEMTKDTFTLRVHDTGVGIPPENRDVVFEPFFTTSQPDPILGIGTGLGLKIVRDLAEAWGGDVEIVPSSSPWRTTVEVVAPLRGHS